MIWQTSPASRVGGRKAKRCYRQAMAFFTEFNDRLARAWCITV